MTGAKLSGKIIKFIRKKYVRYDPYVINVMTAGVDGVSDLVSCINGLFFQFEVKGTGDIENDLQTENIRGVIRSGGYAGYVRSIEDVRLIVDWALWYGEQHPKYIIPPDEHYFLL